ncbi:MAG: hypothetical protein IT426_09705 [Pirellulales bacterium]|nr:hypothetical protein [Pirellulales bacterium]
MFGFFPQFERRKNTGGYRLIVSFLMLLAAAGGSSDAADRSKETIERAEPPGNKERLEKARQTVVRMFQKSYDEASTPAKKQKLARELLDNVPRIANNLEVRYALLIEAREQATAAGHLPTALEAIDLAAKYFRVDAIGLKTAALEKLSRSARDAAQQRDVAAAALALCRAALKDDRFDDAHRLAMLALVSARKSRSTLLIGQCNAAQLEIMKAKKQGNK